MQDSATVAAADIARLAGVGRAAVSNWRRRFGDFPAPVGGTSSSPLFSLVEIEDWLRRQGKLAEVPLEERVWQELRSSVEDLQLPEAVGRVGAFLLSGSTDIPVPSSLTALTAARGPAATFDFLYERYLEAHSRRVTETSTEVADLVVALAGVADGSVLDPACGFGTLLVKAAGSGAATLYGQERDPASASIAQARLQLHGYDSIVVPADSLREDSFASLEADAVVCIPPFGERQWGYDELANDIRWTYGLPPRSEPELPWVQHCLFHLRPGGHAVILMPSAAADRRSGRRIRAQLLRAGALRATIALPAGAAPGALGAPHLWVLRKPDSSDPIPTHVLMVDAADLPWAEVHGYIVERWKAFTTSTDVDGSVPIIDLLDEIVDLTPRPSASDPDAVGLQLTTALNTAKGLLDELQRAIDQLQAIRAGGQGVPKTTIAEQAKAGALTLHTAPRIKTGSGRIPVLTLTDLLARQSPTGRTAPYADMISLQRGDVVVPTGGRSFAVHIVEEGDAVLGPGLHLLRPDPDRLDPSCLAGFLRIAALQAPGRGQTSASRSDIRRIEIPRIAIAEQRSLGQAFNRLETLETLLSRLSASGSTLISLTLHGLSEGALVP